VALPDLIARLEHDAQAQVETIVQRADAEVRAIEAATAGTLAEAAARARTERRTALRATLQRDVSQARRQARTDVLEARRTLVARVLQRARSLAADGASAPRHQETGARQLEDVMSYLEGLDVRVRCSADWASVLQEVASRRGIRLEIDTAVGPGFVAEAIDGSVTIDHTFAARLDRHEGQLAIDLMAEVGRERG